jgi:hypothetical protein
MGFSGNPKPEAVLVRNNIFVARGLPYISNKSGFTHEFNIYSIGPDVSVYEMGLGEQDTDPQFVDLIGQDFHLRPTSPAIQAGIFTGGFGDIMDSLFASLQRVDLGAYQFQGS